MSDWTAFMIGFFVLMFISACAGAAQRQVKHSKTPTEEPIIDLLLKELHMTCDANWSPCEMCHKPRHKVTHISTRILENTFLLCKNCLIAKYESRALPNYGASDSCIEALQWAVNDMRLSCEKDLEARQILLEKTLESFYTLTSQEFFPDNHPVRVRVYRAFIETNEKSIEALRTLIAQLTPTLVRDTASVLAENWKTQHPSQMKMAQESIDRVK